MRIKIEITADLASIFIVTRSSGSTVGMDLSLGMASRQIRHDVIIRVIFIAIFST